MLVILLNMATMSIEHYDEPQRLTDVLHYINTVFIAIFTLECVIKLVGLRWYYFRQPWNVFDFVVVIISILGKIPLVPSRISFDAFYGLAGILCVLLVWVAFI